MSAINSWGETGDQDDFKRKIKERYGEDIIASLSSNKDFSEEDVEDRKMFIAMKPSLM